MGKCCSKEGVAKVYPATEDTFDAQGVRRNSLKGLVTLGLLPNSEVKGLLDTTLPGNS